MRSPDGAPPRPDLGWLRHRRVEHHRIAYVHPPKPAAAPVPAAPAPGPTPAPPALDLSPPGPPAPRPAPAGRSPSAPAAPSLDLSPPIRPAAPPPSRPAPAGPTLDLTPPAAAAPGRAPRRTRSRTLPYPRLAPGTTTVLKGRERTVTLTRLQSGVGTLQLALSRADRAGDLALGLVLATTDGATHVVQRLGDALATPAHPLPLARLAGSPGRETALIDLRQVRTLERALVYGYSPSVSVLEWDGVLALTTYDGSRVEMPFDLPKLSGTVALLTLYQVHGELVLRAELEAFAGPPETAAEAFGHHYGWLGGRLPTR